MFCVICHWLICMDISCHMGGFRFELYAVLRVPGVLKNGHGWLSLSALEHESVNVFLGAVKFVSVHIFPQFETWKLQK